MPVLKYRSVLKYKPEVRPFCTNKRQAWNRCGRQIQAGAEGQMHYCTNRSWGLLFISGFTV